MTGPEPLPSGVVPDLSNHRLIRKVGMAPDHFKCLSEFYRGTYDLLESAYISKVIEIFLAIRFHGKTYNSAESRSVKGTYIQYLFLSQARATPEAWPGKVMYFFRHQTVR